MLQDRVTTSYRRVSDERWRHADSGTAHRTQTPLPIHEGEAQQLEAWEGEGGKTAYVEPVRMRILIVDNDMNTADSLELMLHASGYLQTRVAYSGHAALAIAAEFEPDVVLLEINLQDMSGYEVAQLLRGRAGRDDLRLIALTSSREHAGRELARVAGFERYLLRPVAVLDLVQLLQIPSASHPSERTRRKSR
jgi:CheY-like chemotaxis protein